MSDGIGSQPCSPKAHNLYQEYNPKSLPNRHGPSTDIPSRVFVDRADKRHRTAARLHGIIAATRQLQTQIAAYFLQLKFLKRKVHIALRKESRSILLQSFKILTAIVCCPMLPLWISPKEPDAIEWTSILTPLRTKHSGYSPDDRDNLTSVLMWRGLYAESTVKFKRCHNHRKAALVI